jgi:predicted ferric reductase
MTAANQSLVRAARVPAGPAPARTARLVVWLVVVANLTAVEVMFGVGEAAEPARNTLVAIGRFLGLHAALLMIAQLLLIARLPWLDRRIGMDRLTSWHRWVGLSLFWVVLLHPTFVILGYSSFYHLSIFDQFVAFTGVVPTVLGMCAAATVVVAVAFSVRAARRRLSYELWHAIHLLVYAAITLAIIHQVFEASTFNYSVVTRAYWWTLWTVAGLALVIGRFVTPLVRNARHRLRVSAVVPESPDVVSVYVTGRHLDRLKARPGQFLIWRFLGHNRWWQANPFSLSAAPNGQTLRLTAKAVGTASAGLRRLPVGTRVFVEGPYGALTTLHRRRDGTLLIAGGVGITPIRSLLEELDGPVVVLYRVRTEADAVLLAELHKLAGSRDARIQVLTGRTGPDNDPFAPRSLQSLVPDIVERDIYVCGPPAMTTAVLHSLRALKVPRAQIHTERFSLAG